MSGCAGAIRQTYLRNDALRVRFEHRQGELVQWVGTELSEPEFVDFTNESDPEAACKRWIEEASTRALSLNGPLTSTAILVDRPDSFLVYACFHHAVGDGWSVNLAMRQLFDLYASGAQANTATGVEPASYLDFVRAVTEYRGSPDWVADREYFVAQYRDVEPALFSRNGSIRSWRRRRHTLRVKPATAQRIRDTGRSIFAFTAAALGEYLRRVHRGGDIVLGVPFLNGQVGGRELRTVGCAVNILPLRVPIDSEMPATDLADLVSAQVWELQARQRFAFSDALPKLRAGGRMVSDALRRNVLVSDSSG